LMCFVLNYGTLCFTGVNKSRQCKNSLRAGINQYPATERNHMDFRLYAENKCDLFY
jgi:hypothetical protein